MKKSDCSRENNNNWKGGRKDVSNGYPAILDPSHPRARSSGYVPIYVMMAVAAFGRALPDNAVVHHGNGNKKESKDLVICESQRYHLLLHRRLRAFRQCGNANWLKCPRCKKYDDPNNLIVWRNRDDTKSFGEHPECKSKVYRDWYENNRKA
jgi:hypothetical protein